MILSTTTAEIEGLKKLYPRRGEKLEKYKEITGSDVYKPSEMLLKLAKDGLKLGEAPSKEERKEKLGFEMSSVANNF